MTTADLLRGIANAPRPAGSASEASARRMCAEWLRAAGFDVEEQPFTYSAFPGALATPLAGLLLLGTAVLSLAAITLDGRSATAVICGAVAAVLMVAIGAWWTARYGTRLLPVMRRCSSNLVARRGVPAVWLVAHLDSKSQPVSLLVRASATVGIAVGWSGAIIACGLSRVAPVPDLALIAFLCLAGVSAIPLAVSSVGDSGCGALDNASGVAAILGAVLSELAFGVGVVVTSGEEYGLAGARAWVAGTASGIAINCDGVDDTGRLTITAGGRNAAKWRSARVREVAGGEVRFRRSLPGVLLDSAAFADEGWMTCTVSKGMLSSLARIHTKRDTLDELSGAGVDEASGLIASLAGAVIEGQQN